MIAFSEEDRRNAPGPCLVPHASRFFTGTLYLALPAVHLPVDADLTRQVVQHLKKNLKELSEEIQERAERVLSLEGKIMDQFNAVITRKFSAMKIRIHGDYHLARSLYGKDFMIIDFEASLPGH